MNKLTTVLIIILVALAGCSKTEVKEPLEYKGPLYEVENVEMFLAQNELIKIKLNTPLMQELKNGDQEFPKGIYIEFFDETGRLKNTLKANHAFYFKNQDVWRGQGDVEVKNVLKSEQLNTEELFWKQAEKNIYSDKFVTIRQQTDVIYGEGLNAKDDLSEYTITKIKGVFHVNE